MRVMSDAVVTRDEFDQLLDEKDKLKKFVVGITIAGTVLHLITIAVLLEIFLK